MPGSPVLRRQTGMKIRSAILSFTDDEINRLLKNLELPVSEVIVESSGGKLLVRVKKGISFKVSIVFAADGRHLSATVDAGSFGNPIVSRILTRVTESYREWGVTLCDRTMVFDPRAAMIKAGVKGDFRVDKTAVGAGELVFSLDGELPLDQFVNKVKS